MMFPEPDREGQAQDEALAATLRQGRVILGHAMRFDGAAPEGQKCELHPVSPAVLRTGEDPGDTPYFHATAVVCNLPMLSEAAGASGYMNAAPDADGILRRVPLLMEL